MKRLSIMALGSMILLCVPAFAQQNTQKGGSGGAESSVMVTGCIAEGTGASEYTLRDENGRTFDLASTTVNIKPHIGHKVTITGTPEPPSERAPSRTKSAQGDQNLQLRVTNLKMVSTTCP